MANAMMNAGVTAGPLKYFNDSTPSAPLEKSSSAECIVGARVWHLQTDRGLPKLQSVTLKTLWPYRKAMGRDTINATGIHAIRLGGAIIDLFRQYSAAIAGEVYLWGKVVEHEAGYLADFAYPKKLMVPPTFDIVTMMQLEDEYGVPVEYREELEY